MFKHFIITRFNLPSADWNKNKNKKSVLTDEWHTKRFKVFKDFCFSSVAAQTNKNFEWLVFFDTNTPVKFKEIIVKLESEFKNFSPVFVDDMSYFLPTIQSYIAKCKEDYIITSRLDNDDCISKFYIEEIQKRFDNQNFMAIDFVDGYTVQTQPSVKIGKRWDQYNPFISLIEKNKNPRSVWFVTRHSHWKRENNILQIRNIRIWSSVIHDENFTNSFYGYGNALPSEFFENFKISEVKRNHILENIIPYENWKKESLNNYLYSFWNYTAKKLKKKLGFYKYKKN